MEQKQNFDRHEEHVLATMRGLQYPTWTGLRVKDAVWMEDTMMSVSAPAIWSAVAASFSALSSVLIMLVHRRNLLEASRPELVLTSWQRYSRGSGDAGHEVISFKALKNVGRGTAFNVFFQSPPIPEGISPVSLGVFVDQFPVHVLTSSESVTLNGEVSLWWKNGKGGKDAHRFAPIHISILCWDAVGRRHETRYTLLAYPLDERVHVSSNVVAPAVVMASRVTKVQPVWWLKLGNRTVKGLRYLSRRKRPPRRTASAGA